MFVAFTVVAVWLGWNANTVRQRREFLAAGDWGIYELALQSTRMKPPSVSWVRRLLGDVPAPVFLLHEEVASKVKLGRARQLFPESEVIQHISRAKPEPVRRAKH